MTHNDTTPLAVSPSPPLAAPTAAGQLGLGVFRPFECVFALPSFVCWFENGQYFRKVARARDVRILSPHALFKRIHTFPICIRKGSPKGSVCRPTHYVTAKLLRFTIRKDAWLDSSPSPDLRTHVAAPGSQSPRRLPPNGPRRVQDVLPLPDPSD